MDPFPIGVQDVHGNAPIAGDIMGQDAEYFLDGGVQGKFRRGQSPQPDFHPGGNGFRRRGVMANRAALHKDDRLVAVASNRGGG